jgi:hypothetical protein
MLTLMQVRHLKESLFTHIFLAWWYQLRLSKSIVVSLNLPRENIILQFEIIYHQAPRVLSQKLATITGTTARSCNGWQLLGSIVTVGTNDTA